MPIQKLIEALRLVGSLDPPAPESAVHDMEQQLARLGSPSKLPPTYAAFLNSCDGGQLREGQVLLLGLQNGALLEYNGPESAFQDPSIDTYKDFRSLLIFALDGASNLWAFDTRERTPDGEMAVVFGDHETGQVTPQARNFGEFLTQVISANLERSEAQDSGLEIVTTPRYPEIVTRVRAMPPAGLYYRMSPPNCGYSGPNTVFVPPKDDRSLPTYSSIDVALESWRGAALVCAGPWYLVTRSLEEDMWSAGLSGFRSDLVSVAASAALRRKAKGVPIPVPALRWLIVEGTATYDRDGNMTAHSGHDLCEGLMSPRYTAQELMEAAAAGKKVIPVSGMIASQRFVTLLNSHGAKGCGKIAVSRI